MNGAGPPDKAQPLGLSTLQGWTRAQTPCPVFSCGSPEERQPARGSHGGEAPGHARSLIHPLLAHARTRHQGPWEVMCAGAGPRARAQPLGFSDTAGTDPSTDAMPVLNHEAVVGRLARARDFLGDEAPVRQLIISRQLIKEGKLVLIDAKGIHVAGTDPRDMGIVQPEVRPKLNKLKDATWHRC